MRLNPHKLSQIQTVTKFSFPFNDLDFLKSQGKIDEKQISRLEKSFSLEDKEQQLIQLKRETTINNSQQPENQNQNSEEFFKLEDYGKYDYYRDEPIETKKNKSSKGITIIQEQQKKDNNPFVSPFHVFRHFYSSPFPLYFDKREIRRLKNLDFNIQIERKNFDILFSKTNEIELNQSTTSSISVNISSGSSRAPHSPIRARFLSPRHDIVDDLRDLVTLYSPPRISSPNGKKKNPQFQSIMEPIVGSPLTRTQNGVTRPDLGQMWSESDLESSDLDKYSIIDFDLDNNYYYENWEKFNNDLSVEHLFMKLKTSRTTVVTGRL